MRRTVALLGLFTCLGSARADVGAWMPTTRVHAASASPNVADRLRAVRMAKRLPRGQAIAALRDLAVNEDASVRVAILQALAQLGATEALELFDASRHAQEIDVQRAAHFGLAMLANEDALAALCDSLRMPHTRDVAIEAILRLAVAPTPRLVRMAATESSEVSLEGLMLALIALRDPRAMTLASELTISGPQNVRPLAQMLVSVLQTGSVLTSSSRTLRDALQALREPDATVVNALQSSPSAMAQPLSYPAIAAHALDLAWPHWIAIGVAQSRGWSDAWRAAWQRDLRMSLQAQSADVRAAAVMAIADLDPNSTLVMTALDDPDPLVRYAAARSLFFMPRSVSERLFLRSRAQIELDREVSLALLDAAESTSVLEGSPWWASWGQSNANDSFREDQRK